jgi:hypothetical protein
MSYNNESMKCVTVEKWDPYANDYSQPKPNKLQGKNVYINNTQIRSNLVLQTPLMRTWGISMFVDEAGEAKGGYSMSLIFDNEQYETEETAAFKKKLQQFEEEIVCKAYENRMAWFGDDDITLDTIRTGFYPILKYPKLKDAKGKPTKKKDMSKPPTFKIRVNNYEDKWQCRVYDTNLQPLFVPEDKDSSPIDFVPKGSMVITKIKCDGIWTGSGTSWGIKWNLQVAVVQPIEKRNQDPYNVMDMDTSKFTALTTATVKVSGEEVIKAEESINSTHVEDSDDEKVNPVVDEELSSPTPVEVVPPVVTEVKKKVVKKVVK